MQTLIDGKVLALTHPYEGLTDMTVLCPPMAAAALPGQFVHIKCGDQRLLRRPVSFADADAGAGTLRLLFETRGEGTLWLSRRKPGDVLDMLGPLGNGFSFAPGLRLLLVGGGIGIFPLLLLAKRQGGCRAALGFRSRERLAVLEDLSESCLQTAVVTEDGSFGERGLVTAPAEGMLRAGGIDAVAACGPKPMLRAVKELAKRHALPCLLSMEERMGCGVGACLGCACALKYGEMETFGRVCRDGPVFDAEVLNLDD